MKNDDFGDRMKTYEGVYTQTKISPPDILCVRIDGKCFSKFTRSFDKPFDSMLTVAMIATTADLMRETHAAVGYTQSDEITLIFTPSEKSNEYIFGGKISKLNSVFASMATGFFNRVLATQGKPPAMFDCRAFAVPSLVEASNVLLWRAQDARKNSVSSLFRWTASARRMQGLDQYKMKEVLKDDYDIDWNDLEPMYRHGVMMRPVSVMRKMTDEERNKIPEANRPKMETLVQRTDLEAIEKFYGDFSLEERIAFITKEKQCA